MPRLRSAPVPLSLLLLLEPHYLLRIFHSINFILSASLHLSVCLFVCLSLSLSNFFPTRWKWCPERQKACECLREFKIKVVSSSRGSFAPLRLVLIFVLQIISSIFCQLCQACRPSVRPSFDRLCNRSRYIVSRQIDDTIVMKRL